MARSPSGRPRPAAPSLAAELLTNAGHIGPPGGCSTFVEHPTARLRDSRSVEVGVVIEHRFAFFHWLRCKRELLRRAGVADEAFAPPDLISFDWHDDCGCESDFDTGQLARLDQQNETEVAVFCWAGLRPLNDGHILPAMWLNAVGNAYIVQRQHRDCRRENRSFTDRFGRPHHVFYFRRPDDLPATFAETSGVAGVVWDVDMDYFTRAREVPDRKYTSPLRGDEIRALLAPGRPWMPLILSDLRAVTVALEPEYTGGLGRSLELFTHWERSLFAGSVFGERCRWRSGFR